MSRGGLTGLSLSVFCVSRPLDGVKDALVVLSRRTRLPGFAGLEIMTAGGAVALREDSGRDLRIARQSAYAEDKLQIRLAERWLDN